MLMDPITPLPMEHHHAHHHLSNSHHDLNVNSAVAQQNNHDHNHGRVQHEVQHLDLDQEREYLMTKTAAMHFGGPSSGSHHSGMGGSGGGSSMGVSGGSGSGGSNSGRDVKPHQCQQCLKTFSSNHQLVQHIRVHTGEKPYKCSYCDRRFKQLSHVQQHTRLHTGERPYKCHVPDCGRAFIQLSNLQQHLRNHESQLERLKNRPFHCAICGKGFATESSMRTHNSKGNCNSSRAGGASRLSMKNHTALVGGPNPSCCPICQKLCISGEELMEHMKYVHKDPNASGVPAKRRSANHPCPVCGKFYVNEGSLRKHLACHPEMTSQLSSSLRMWPCSVCTAVFTHENGLLAHMDQMRMDPKHQFAAQYVLSRAANERREREALLAAHLAMTTNMQPSLLSGHMTSAAAAHHMAVAVSTAAAASVAGIGGTGTGSPSAHSDSSTRISTPMNTAAEMKMEPRTTNVRSPLSLGLSHHQIQQQLMAGQGGNLDYLGGQPGGGGRNNSGNNGLDIPRNSSNDLRLTSPGPSNDILSNNNNTAGSATGNNDHLLNTGNGQSQHHQDIPNDERMSLQLTNSSNDPRGDASLDSGSASVAANNAAFMALRANPETTIRPLNSNSGLGSPDNTGLVTSVASNLAPSVSASADLHSSPHDSQFSAASDLINRYRLEQTINQLRSHHGFAGADPRGIAGLPFNQHNQV